MKFSVIIPTYNRQETLRQCLAVATNQDYPDYEVIVVDDGSTDGTAIMVRQEFPQVRYFRQEVNRGPAAARNRGIHEATGEIIAFTDDDCVPPPNWLTRLADGYRRYPQVAGVGGYQEATYEVKAKSSLARYESYINRQVYRVGDQEYLGRFECPAGGTNNISYQRSIIEEIGGFDETFPLAAGEDAYFKWQLVKKDKLLLFVPVQVIHLQSYKLAPFWRQQVRRGMGAAHFEWRTSGHYPRPLRIFLRWGKRTVAFFLDLIRMGPQLAGIHIIGGWADVYGQYIAWRHYRPQFENQ